MASGGVVPENLRKQLAVAVRSIQWSYAIIWSTSSSHPGVLEWGDGYYNGDIKTRKTVQAVEFNADQLGLLQRSEQLRELYESLAAGESSPQARRPSAALSPEDLTDREWYYLVCMSFVFNVGQGLPGRTLADGQLNWLCNAHYADSKIFTRSLLAKTVVCFPFLGGVIELGVTEVVLEDPGLIQHIKTSFLDIPYPIVSKKSNSPSGNARTDKDPFPTDFIAIVGCEELEVFSPNNNPNQYGIDQQAEDSFMVEGASQVQSWQLMDEEFSNCVHNSTSSSDCISQILVDPENVPKGERENDGFTLDLQEHNQMKMTSMGLEADDDIHYQSVISTLLKSSHQLILGPNFRNCNHESSFVSWKKGGFAGNQMPRRRTPTKSAKEKDDGKRDAQWSPQVDEIDSSHVLAERRRREKINKRFSVLESLVPSTSKVDKVSILDNTIEYVKELERRVEELNACKEVADPRQTPQDTAEMTSENYGFNKIGNSKKPLINKRKAREIDEIIDPEKDSSTGNVTVSVIDKEVLIEIRCSWRECLLLEIMDAITHLHLDSYSVQSTNTNGILSLTVKSKFKGSSTFASVGAIGQALQRVVGKC
ncbi:basic helix-loop-helix (bHLH) DNA-binding superfamily protein [Actinidia rufa]|uniref:Basic helix-loop-helix (BHLH) DNA-binding superfamily protein n=1 Tax=Actinidia rufa TaxID=165716 RepID=A0A7J0DKP6_9ERIC|nr:basic helix-loop-helix (bHLH) DNA-binding superfamily protein [Actinidia rufa]